MATVGRSRRQPRGFLFQSQGESRAVVTRFAPQTEMDFDRIRLMQSRGQRDGEVLQWPRRLNIAARETPRDHPVVAGQDFGSVFVVRQHPRAAARLPILQRTAVKEWLAPTIRPQLKA